MFKVFRNYLSLQRKWLMPTLLSLIMTAVLAVSYLYKPATIAQLGNLATDHFHRSHPREYNPDTPVRIIDIDEESIARIGQWPWPRTTMAKLNDNLNNAGAEVIAYDMIFSEADRTSPENIVTVLRDNPLATESFQNLANLKSHDAVFAESLARSNSVMGIFLVPKPSADLPAVKQGFAFLGDPPLGAIPNYGGSLQSLPQLEACASGNGNVSFQPDGDSIIRTAPMLARVGDRVFPSLAMDALRAAQGAKSFAVKSSNASGELQAVDKVETQVTSIRVGDFTVPSDENGKLQLYLTESKPERFIPAWKILLTSGDWEERIGGHIVFIGTGAEGLKDIKSTPLNAAEPGVTVHAQAAEQIINEQYLLRPYWANMIEMFALVGAGVVLSLALPRLSAAKGAILTLIIGLIVWNAAQWAFVNKQFILDPVYPLLVVLSVYLIASLSSFYLTESERSQIRNAFSMYLSPDLVRKVSEDPSLLKLGGEDREMTILFLDVRSFSRISESMTPSDITTFLNLFLTPMTDILQDNKATIDKYMGDAIVAFWNAPLDDPDHQANAVRAVLDMQTALDDLNAKYAAQDEVKWPEKVRMGIGLNTGVCTVGNLGSQQRFSYSIIGDAANVASRIEGLTKQYGVTSMAGEAAAKDMTEFALLEADLIKVVGRDTPERIFMICGDEVLARSKTFSAFKSAHVAFLGSYRAGDFVKAEAQARALEAEAGRYNVAGYYRTLLARISIYRHDPPENWTGIYEAQSK